MALVEADDDNRIITHTIYPTFHTAEDGWCEYCEQEICRNKEFYAEVIEDDCMYHKLDEINDAYFHKLKKYFLSRDTNDALDASPRQYVRIIRFFLYKDYAKKYNLPWGKKKMKELPHCVVGMIRLLFRMPAKSVELWISGPVPAPMMYDVHKDESDVLSLGKTNKYSRLDDVSSIYDPNKKVRNNNVE